MINNQQEYYSNVNNSGLEGTTILKRTNVTPKTLYSDITSRDNIHLIAAYNSPNKDFSIKDLDRLLNINNRVLLVGDLNARHQA
ncbi:unnamed protein product [Lasius platythorax]|uniref:Endonuclease/exonuclease/phosphatase domain-containing protein n=1 Tax=Lasius platythorax TaxID=488582 RepID=A0AAV2NNU5_9HYME